MTSRSNVVDNSNTPSRGYFYGQRCGEHLGFGNIIQCTTDVTAAKQQAADGGHIWMITPSNADMLDLTQDSTLDQVLRDLRADFDGDILVPEFRRYLAAETNWAELIKQPGRKITLWLWERYRAHWVLLQSGAIVYTNEFLTASDVTDQYVGRLSK